jgi:A/G-specific adenine glycosylase
MLASVPASAPAVDQPDPAAVRGVNEALVGWYRREGRDLPWRRTHDPYAILISEVMLQQTQVDRVIPRWHAWLAQFPTLAALAAAPRADVIRAWSGLGYNLRAVRLHEMARVACEQYSGALPDSLEALLTLKGMGRYTAGAVACFGLGQAVSVVDTNVRRVLGRVFLGEPQVEARRDREMQKLADAVLPIADAYDWNQALMDLGATICTAGRPLCLICPLRDLCAAAPQMSAWPAERQRTLREARTEYATATRRKSESQRLLRGRIVREIQALPSGTALSLDDLEQRLATSGQPAERAHLERLIQALAADGLMVVQQADGQPSPTLSLPH